MYRLPPAASAPEFRGLLDYWLSKFPAKRPANDPGALGVGWPGDWLPGRKHIDPAEFPARQLAQMLLFDVVPGPGGRRFRFRVAGTAFATLAGRDVTGRFYDELGAPERVAAVSAAMNLIVERRAPVFIEGRLTLPSEEYFWVKRLGLPLAQNGSDVDMVLGIWLAERRAASDFTQAVLAEPDGDGPQLLERI